MTTIVPRPDRRLGEGQPMGNLAHAMLSVTVAGMADPARYRRGKAYAAEGAVLRLIIEPGVLRASVLGSRDEAYDVVVAVDTVPAPPRIDHPDRGDITRLTPQADELVVSCTCPDWDDPCKHAVAVLLAFAGELTDHPSLLVEWRCGPGGQRRRAAVGSGARAMPEPEPVDPLATPAWTAFFGEVPPVLHRPFPPSEPVAFPSRMVHGIDLGALLTDAIRRIAR